METDTFRLVSVLDTAIDTARMTTSDMLAYAKERKHDQIMRFVKPGKRPAVFVCREVPASLWSWVDEAPGDAEKCRRAFCCGLVKAEDLPQKDGSVMPSWAPPKAPGQLALIDDETLAARFYPYQWVEIGMVIHTRSFLGPMIEADYRLPPTLASFLTRREFLLADPSPNEQAPSSVEVCSGLEGEEPEGASQDATESGPTESAGASV